MNPLQRPIGSGFNEATEPQDVMAGIDLAGKIAVVTGGHGGLGLETTKALINAGARVVVGARDPQAAARNLAGVPRVAVEQLDLADPASIAVFASRYAAGEGRCDILINNAGIMATPLMRDARGYEMQFATNHLGHFQLTLALRGALERAGGARVVALTSLGHRFSPVVLDDVNFVNRPYDPWLAYGQSKTANALFAWQLDKIARDTGIRAFSVHPGRVPTTELSRFMSQEQRDAAIRATAVGPNYIPAFMKSISQGASTSLWAATSPMLDGIGGVYCADCDVAALVADDDPAVNGVKRWAVDEDAAAALWALSEKLLAAR